MSSQKLQSPLKPTSALIKVAQAKPTAQKKQKKPETPFQPPEDDFDKDEMYLLFCLSECRFNEEELEELEDEEE